MTFWTFRLGTAVADDPLCERVDGSYNFSVAVTENDSAFESSGLIEDTCLGDSDYVSGICRCVIEQKSPCDRRSGCLCVCRLSS